MERGKRTVLFVDAALFLYGPYLADVWCAVRSFVRGPSGRKRDNVLAALNAETREVIRVTNHGYINARSVCDLLAKVAAAGEMGADGVLFSQHAFAKVPIIARAKTIVVFGSEPPPARRTTSGRPPLEDEDPSRTAFSNAVEGPLLPAMRIAEKERSRSEDLNPREAQALRSQ